RAGATVAWIGLGCQPLMLAGGDAAERWLGPTAAGEACAGFALTEPEAGSDVAGMQSRAERVDGGYRLTGRKTVISNPPIAHWFGGFGRAEGGPAAFIVERDDGIRVADDVPLSAPHPIGSIELAGVVVGEERRLGEEGQGLKLALATLDTFRASVGAAACGMA